MPLKQIRQAAPQPSPVEPAPPRPPPGSSPQFPVVPTRSERTSAIPAPFIEEINYPSYDGLPMADNTDQAFDMSSAYHTLLDFFWERNDVFVATNLLVYYREGDNTTRVTPDVMVAFGRPSGYRGSYKVWEEGNHPPDWVLEVASEGTVDVDVNEKPDIYGGIGVPEYWQYDPTGGLLNPRLQGWRLNGLKYTELPQVPVAGAEIAIYSEVLGLRLEFDGEELRFWDPVEEQYLYSPLGAQRARRESDQARREEQQRRHEAEQARHEAERARREEQQRRHEAEQGQREAEQARHEAEQARREAERLAQALKARVEASERREQALRASIADLPAGSQPPDGSED